MKKCFFVIICLTFCRIDLTFAQLQTDELPISFSQPNFTLNNRTVNGMTVYQLPSLNNDQLLQEATTQAENCKNCRSLYYGKEMSLDIDLKHLDCRKEKKSLFTPRTEKKSMVLLPKPTTAPMAVF